MKKEIKTGFIELFTVLTFNKVPLSQRLLFLLIYPFDLLVILISLKKKHRKAVFLDGRPFEFLGAHYNLILNHIAWHINKYSKYYDKADTVIDLGASFGTFPRMVQLLNPKAKVYSIEMVKESFVLLSVNCQRLKNVTLSNVAIGNVAKTIEYSFQGDYPEGGNVGKIQYANKGKAQQITLDQYISKNKIKHVSLLKMDVEGYEVEALKGASKALKIIDCLIIEVAFSMDNIMQVMNIMQSHGFSLINVGALNMETEENIGSADLIFRKENKKKK